MQYYHSYHVVIPNLDADAEVEGAPGAPLDVCCLDANKDYIIVTWKQPAVEGGNSILGYFVDRLVVVLMFDSLQYSMWHVQVANSPMKDF